MKIRPGDIREFKIKMSDYLVKLKKEGKTSNKEIAELILQESKNEVPKYSGTLASTQFILEREDDKGTIELGYGGPNVKVNPSGQSTDKYMVRMHEDLSAKHQVGKAKYLEDPFLRNVLRASSKLASDLGKVKP